MIFSKSNTTNQFLGTLECRKQKKEVVIQKPHRPRILGNVWAAQFQAWGHKAISPSTWRWNFQSRKTSEEESGGGRGREAICVSQRHSEIQQWGEEGGRSTAASLYSWGGVVPAFVGYLSLYLFLSHRRHPINVWWMNDWLNVFPWKGRKQQNYQVQYRNSICSHTPRL